MRREILPELGSVRLSEAPPGAIWQAFADRLLARGEWSPSAVGVTLLPLRALYRRALAREEAGGQPMHRPATPGYPRKARALWRRPEEAESLLAAVPERDRATWATAMYAGLRRRRIARPPSRDDVDLAGGVIRVERGWDPVEGAIELKSHAGRRKVPVAAACGTTWPSIWPEWADSATS